MLRNFLLYLAFALACSGISAQSPLGTWKTIDDETGEAKSYVEIYEANGVLYGKITKLLRKNAPVLCEKCPAERKNQPLIGMVILVNMKAKDGYWQSGSILDPEKGKWYDCKLWLKAGDPNTLQLRGYLGPFYRTQQWIRVQ